ncbi:MULTISPECIES: c-type cytochrome [Photobacterium]|uniref:Cytochrome C n=1 Tax=Photobacterium ganghwense TaxID=320778 RepID=A0A0J1HG12_9GAMM|nr:MULTISPECIES: c-type cytochrome [Photobacterium]KLV10583.1 cytochrome C [Photobacterium ganghwense]MBV1843256.1 c-type cytochrome [Photobacterium ganghwense]PSU09509.1 cytochrome C [Photobacterium ganghwense]QSV16755.1 c-type cytochrome [Photobacterium ganghwense]
MKSVLTIIALSSLLLTTGCEPNQRGNTLSFTLPQGNAQRGEQLFEKYQCLSCHTMEGYERPEVLDESGVSVELGGRVPKLKTYAELVTSVINPSHSIAPGYDVQEVTHSGESIMPSYNDVMTVTDLVDLITFLEAKYELEPYEYTTYGKYR